MEATDPFTIGEKVMLQIDRYGNIPFDKLDMPFGLTQRGVAMAVGISRAHASIELKKRLVKEEIEVSEAHVRNCSRKLMVYTLTNKGRETAENLRKIAEKNHIKIDDLFYDQKRWTRYGVNNKLVLMKDDLSKIIELIDVNMKESGMTHMHPAVPLMLEALEILITHIEEEEQ